MTVTAAVLAYATLLAAGGQLVLRRLTRSGAAPQLGVLAWQLAVATVVASWVLGGLALGGPVPLHDLSHAVAARVAAVNGLIETRAAHWPQVAGLIAAGAVLARAVWCVAVDAGTSYRRRVRHARMLRMIARPLPGHDAVVVEHDAVLAYCLPGRIRQVVVTRGALDNLSPGELAAVLEHERAHLAGRHHLVLAPLRALARAFPGVPLMSAAAREATRLLEMCADDRAARRHGRAAVAGALRALSTVDSPAGSLAAAGADVQERIARLQDAGRRTGASAVLVTAVTLLTLGPPLALVGPLVAAAWSGYCAVPITV